MNGLEKDESAAAPDIQVRAAEGVLSRDELFEQTRAHGGELGCGSADTDHLWPLESSMERDQFSDGEGQTVPFFSSFFDNLGPRYHPPQIDSDWFPSTSSDDRHLREAGQHSEPNKTPTPTVCRAACGDSHGDGFTPSVTKLRSTIQNQGAALSTPNSSTRAVHCDQLMPADAESDLELSSASKPLIVMNSDSAAACALNSSLPSIACVTPVISGRKINFDASGEDCGCLFRCPTPGSSTGWSGTELTFRDLQRQGRELEFSHRLSTDGSHLKRVRLEMDFEDFPETFLPSPRDDLNDIVECAMHVVQYRSALERRLRLRTLMSPRGPPVSRSDEAMALTRITTERWHHLLGLDNPASPIIAADFFARALRKFKRSAWPKHMRESPRDRVRVRVLMAAAFWVAAKLADTLLKVPKASHMAKTASITAGSLVSAELSLLDALKWKLVQIPLKLQKLA